MFVSRLIMTLESTPIDTTTDESKNTAPIWFWVISVIAMLWYLMDMSAFFMRVLITEEALLAMPENQRIHMQSIPAWVNAVFAFEVIGGVFGSIGLLLRKKWALPLFIISIFGVFTQTFYVYFISDAFAIMGAPAIIMPLVAILIGVGMIALAKFAIAKKWFT